MNNRERALAVLNYKEYDRLPIVHFCFLQETLEKWHQEGHLSVEEFSAALGWIDGRPIEKVIANKLGFDFNWWNCLWVNSSLKPEFERKVLRTLPDGSRHVLSSDGTTIVEKDSAGSIPAAIDHLLKDRKSWEEHYLPRLQFDEDRIYESCVSTLTDFVPLRNGGLKFLKSDERQDPVGLNCGSLFGLIRNWVGFEGVSYLYFDDEKLFDEIVDVMGELSYRCVKVTLETGAKFDFAHFWEDICFKNGPLVIPSVFASKVGPHYKRITDLCRSYQIEIISLDCDGVIDALIPAWFNNGVNTMFPIEVGTWGASIKPWREKYGKNLRGIGGMDKKVFAKDYAAVDIEIERLKPLVELGGYIPCPDHRIAQDAKWDNVRYYCDKMRNTFAR